VHAVFDLKNLFYLTVSKSDIWGILQGMSSHLDGHATPLEIHQMDTAATADGVDTINRDRLAAPNFLVCGG
jgi:hypothetical protein